MEEEKKKEEEREVEERSPLEQGHNNNNLCSVIRTWFTSVTDLLPLWCPGTWQPSRPLNTCRAAQFHTRQPEIHLKSMKSSILLAVFDWFESA